MKKTLTYCWLAIRDGMSAPVLSYDEMHRDGYWSQVIRTTPGRLRWYVVARAHNGKLVITTTRQARRNSLLILHRVLDVVGA